MRHLARLGVAMCTASLLVFTTITAPASADPVPSSSAAPDIISPADTFTVTLTLDGETVTQSTPTDVVLVVDSSGSIPPSSFHGAVKSFLRDIASELDAAGLFANGGSIGIVRFADSESHILFRGTALGPVHGAINAMAYTGGGTCLGCGVRGATSQLTSIPGSGGGAHNRVMIMLTDGNETLGGASGQISLSASLPASNGAGVERFALGVGNSISVATLNQIATDPDSAHAFQVSGFDDLQDVVTTIVEAVDVPGATDLQVDVDLAAPFALSPGGGDTTSFARASLGDETWTITYDVKVDPAQCGDDLPVHDAITYSDAEGGSVVFAPVTVSVVGCVVADAGPDQTVEQTSPAGADATLDGTGTTGDPTILYTWTYGPTTLNGASPTGSFPAGATTVLLEADNGVTSDSDSVTISVVDTIAPVLTFTGDTTYGLVDTVEITCAATDSGSGVADDCDDANVSAPAYTIGAGDHTVNATATDAAGNVGNGSFDYTVEVDVDGLCALTKLYNTKNNGQEHAMCNKLEDGRYRQYRQHVAAQSGKAFTTAQADQLTELSLLLG